MWFLVSLYSPFHILESSIVLALMRMSDAPKHRWLTPEHFWSINTRTKWVWSWHRSVLFAVTIRDDRQLVLSNQDPVVVCSTESQEEEVGDEWTSVMTIKKKDPRNSMLRSELLYSWLCNSHELVCDPEECVVLGIWQRKIIFFLFSFFMARRSTVQAAHSSRSHDYGHKTLEQDFYRSVIDRILQNLWWGFPALKAEWKLKVPSNKHLGLSKYRKYWP